MPLIQNAGSPGKSWDGEISWPDWIHALRSSGLPGLPDYTGKFPWELLISAATTVASQASKNALGTKGGGPLNPQLNTRIPVKEFNYAQDVLRKAEDAQPNSPTFFQRLAVAVLAYGAPLGEQEQYVLRLQNTDGKYAEEEITVSAMQVQ